MEAVEDPEGYWMECVEGEVRGVGGEREVGYYD